MKLLNIYRPLTATSQGAAAGASYISTDANKWDGANDDHYNGMWIRTTSGSTEEDRYISDYATATGTFTPKPSFSAQIANAVTAEVMPWEPATILDAFQRAIDIAYPNPLVGRKGLFKTIFDEFVANSYIWNGHFEDWNASTIPDHFAAVSGITATVSEETTIIRGPLGTSAVKMTGGAAGDYIYQSHVENPPLLNLEGKTVTFYAWTYAAAASDARITIAYKIASDSSLTTTSSSYHTGNSEYELLSKEVAFPSDITDIQVRLECNDGTVYFDNLYQAAGPQLFHYHISKDFLHDPIAVEEQVNDGDAYGADMIGGEAWALLPNGMWHIEDDGTNRLLVIHRTPDSLLSYTSVDRRKIRVTGNERLTSPTVDTSTVEVVGEQMRALVALAAGEIMASLEAAANAASSAIMDYKGKSAYWRAEGERLLALHGMPMSRNNVNLRIR